MISSQYRSDKEMRMPSHDSQKWVFDEAPWFGPDATEIAFPLGGIGTGNISMGARGNLCDFEIWNEPRKGLVLPYTHFALSTQADGEPSITRVLEGRIPPP